MTVLPVATARQTLAALARTGRRHPLECVLTTTWTLLASAGVVAVPLLLGRLVDAVRWQRSADLRLLGLVALGAALGALFAALAQRATARLAAHVAADLREEVMDRVLGLEPRLLEAAGSGDVTSRVTEDVETFVTAVPMVTAVTSAAGTVLVSAAAVTTLDWRLTIAFTAVLPIYWVALRRYLPQAGPVYAQERQAAAERGRVLLESLHGLPTVHAYDMAALQTQRVEAASEYGLTLRLRTVWLALWLNKSMNTAEAVGLSAIFLTGYWLVGNHLATIGSVTAAALLFHRLFDPLGVLLGSFDEVQRAGAALARIVGVTLVPAPAHRPRRRPDGPVGLAASGIRHSYTGIDVVSAVDVIVPAGTSLAVVGASGAGKTTLAAVLAGMFPPSAGRTTLTDRHGGIDLGALDPGDLRDWIGMVAQETHVFTGTLRDDLSLAAPDGRDDEQIIAALTSVGAQKWVTLLPSGLDTRIGAGAYPLTPVQIQQLALARLMLRDPPVVILDEATAEAGSAGAHDLEESAAALIAGRTAIVIAHRLSQARTCDRIAVMAGGRITEIGSHEDLLDAGGNYARLWATWSRR